MQKNDMNFEKIRKFFPIFNQKVNDHDLVYLDSVSTAQMPQQVIDAIVQYYTTYKSNVGRGVYTFAEQATQQFEDTRQKIANFINAKAKEIVFTSGTTHGINLVARAWALYNVQKGDEILVSEIEHHSNFVPWQQLALQTGATLRIVPVNEQGVVDIQTFKQYLSEKTKFVAIIHTSNVLGATNDVQALTKAAHDVGAKVLIDAAQSVSHQVIDVIKINCDFLVFSGHKLFGPTGIGVLFVKEDIFDLCQLQIFGGGMIFSVGTEKTTFKQMPHCFEAGTQAIAQVIGFGAVIDFINEVIDYEQLQKHETELTQLLAAELQEFEDINIISYVPDQYEHGNLVTFVSERYHAHDIAAYVDQYGIAVRAGHHCVQPFHQKHGINASVRASFSVYNTKQDVECLITSLKELYQQ